MALSSVTPSADSTDYSLQLSMGLQNFVSLRCAQGCRSAPPVAVRSTGLLGRSAAQRNWRRPYIRHAGPRRRASAEIGPGPGTAGDQAGVVNHLVRIILGGSRLAAASLPQLAALAGEGVVAKQRRMREIARERDGSQVKEWRLTGRRKSSGFRQSRRAPRDRPSSVAPSARHLLPQGEKGSPAGHRAVQGGQRCGRCSRCGRRPGRVRACAPIWPGADAFALIRRICHPHAHSPGRARRA